MYRNVRGLPDFLLSVVWGVPIRWITGFHWRDYWPDQRHVRLIVARWWLMLCFLSTPLLAAWFAEKGIKEAENSTERQGRMRRKYKYQRQPDHRYFEWLEPIVARIVELPGLSTMRRLRGASPNAEGHMLCFGSTNDSTKPSTNPETRDLWTQKKALPVEWVSVAFMRGERTPLIAVRPDNRDGKRINRCSTTERADSSNNSSGGHNSHIARRDEARTVLR